MSGNEILSTVLIENSLYLAYGTGVFFVAVVLYILFILSFVCVTILNREMKSVSAI